MSIKSLLQLILFLLIILVIGGIYLLYFYESPKLNVKLKPIIEKNDYNHIPTFWAITLSMDHTCISDRFYFSRQWC